MSKAATLIFALVAYAIFFATFLYLIAFVGDFGLVPRTVNNGPEASVAAAIAIDSALIALFGLQHSIMARPAFKRAWTRFVPPQSERSLFVLFASLALILLFAFWRPIGGRCGASKRRSGRPCCGRSSASAGPWSSSAPSSSTISSCSAFSKPGSTRPAAKRRPR
jgi:protein-S-isoprenylcysteine O-methyltransferase Ste14